MKKLLLLLISLCIIISMLTSCAVIENLIGSILGDNYDDGAGDESPDGDNGKDENEKLYTAFSPSEKRLFNDEFGGPIPFIANNNYYVEPYTLDLGDSYNEGIRYYTYGNTKEEFDSYRTLFAQYNFDGSQLDELENRWYRYYTDGYLAGEVDYYIDLCYYDTNDGYIVDVYVYRTYERNGGGSNDNGGNGGNGGSTDNSGYAYTDFSSSDKQLMLNVLGEILPFIANNEYYLEEYSYDYGDTYEEGLNFYTYGNTSSEFNSYKALFSKYTYDGSEADDYGDMWYFYTAGEFYIDLSYYETDDGYVIDVYAYFLYEGSGDSGSGSGSGSGSNQNSDLITNVGAGLPQGTNGVYDVDFTDGKYVQDVTDQGYYLDGCPTTGSPKVLVIPVDFSDVTASSKGYSISNIITAFTGKSGSTDYFSVEEYYYISSYGTLDLDITVVNEWFRPSKTSSYYAKATIDYYGDTVDIGDQLVLDEALAYLAGKMNLSDYDSDNNGIIDAVVLVTTLTIDDSSDFYWAYRYWNIYTDDDGYYYEYDGVSANDYIWVPYAFMHESYDAMGEADYSDTSVMNTYTFIHEFAHVIGIDDYYDTSSKGDHPLEDCDVMDSMVGDHNPYSKFNMGWITTARLVTASTTLTLDAFAKNGDTIILAAEWDEDLGAYQEYYVIMYYTSEGLNGGDYGYFTRDGIIVYHVNSSLFKDNYDGEIYYDVYNNNTSSSDNYGTEDNLIEFIKSSEGNFTYVAGDSLPKQTDDAGRALPFSFTVVSIDGDSATITFTKN